MPFPPPPPDNEYDDPGSLITTPINRSGNNARVRPNPTSPTPIDTTPQTFATASIEVYPTSSLRKAIVQWAKLYNDKGIAEVGNDQSFTYVENGKKVPDKEFENSIRSVGWKPGHEWCNYFTKLVWRKAYEEVSKNNPIIANIKFSKFNNFEGTNPPITGYCPSTFGNMKKLGASEDFVKGKTQIYPGDMIFYNHNRGYTYDHVNLCVEADNVTRKMKTIGGNQGSGVVSFTERSMDGGPIIEGVSRPIDDPSTSKPPNTYPDDQYKKFADQIESALEGFTEEEDKVYAVWNQMKTTTDLDKLKQAFGSREIASGEGTIVLFKNGPFTLDQALIEYFDDEEFSALNFIMRKNNIKDPKYYYARSQNGQVIIYNPDNAPPDVKIKYK